MNYFELFEIPVQLRVDSHALRNKFMELSRRYHPDFFTNDTPDAQEEALEKIALVNKAWKIFQQPEETIAYVLQRKGLLAENEKYQLDPDFLMEMMEINEAITEQDAEQLPSLKARLQALEQEIYAPVSTIIENYQDDASSEADLLKVKEYYFQKKYLERIRGSLDSL
ncbi:MAG: Fe-S protein assembly co-chaperone HscB [Chitinophagia bacterium]|nr:Fe-S protein assembly co-chaperone HscB [Chitinophagia bacterium]